MAIANEPLAKELFQNNSALPPGVREARLNLLARSVVIAYDAERIPPELVEKLIEAEDDAQAARFLEELDSILKSIAKEVH